MGRRLRRRTVVHGFYLGVIAVLGVLLVLSRRNPPAVDMRPLQMATTPAIGDRRVHVKGDKTTLQKHVEELSKQSGVVIEVMWTGLERAGLAKNQPLEPLAGEKPLHQAITEMLTACGGNPGVEAEWAPESVLIGITDDILNPARCVNVIYPVGDLLMVDEPGPSQSYYDRTQGIGDSLKAMVRPDCWRDNGGTIGAIRFVDDKMIVTGTPGIQYEVSAFLATLRKR